jgi:hypothetical protein
MKMCFSEQIRCHQKRYAVNHIGLTDLDGILTHDLVRNMSIRSHGINFREWKWQRVSGVSLLFNCSLAEMRTGTSRNVQQVQG